MQGIVVHGLIGLGAGVLFGLNFPDLYMEDVQPYLPTIRQQQLQT